MLFRWPWRHRLKGGGGKVAGEREGRREMMEGVGQHSFLPLLPSSFEDAIASSEEDVEEDGYVYWVDKEVAGAGEGLGAGEDEQGEGRTYSFILLEHNRSRD